MLKKRIIFVLLWSNGRFCISRNYTLQSVGNINWLFSSYDFIKIYSALDELVILNVSRGHFDSDQFFSDLHSIANSVFIPLTVGGKISSAEYASSLFHSGVDKILFNSSIYKNPHLIKNISKQYGRQSIIASLDFKRIDDKYKFFSNCGVELIDDYRHTQALSESIGYFGEIFLNSIDRDGTGNGYDFSFLEQYSFDNLPLILCGGASHFNHFKQGLIDDKISGVATSNLFNFVGDGLINARRQLQKQDINIVNRTLS